MKCVAENILMGVIKPASSERSPDTLT